MRVARFDVAGRDATTVIGWRNDGEGTPVLICNGLGTPPSAWPTVIAAGSDFRVASWYYRGTAGGERPADPTRITIEDHVDDALAVMDHEGMDRPLLACWSLGVNIGFELAERYPDRVAGILAVAGLPGGTFSSIGGVLGVPKRLRHRVGLAAAHAGRVAGPALSWTARRIPVNRVTSNLISHSGFLLPGATPDRLMPALAEYREHDFRWYFTLAVAASEHPAMNLAFVTQPVTLVAGRYDVITSMHDMVAAAREIPHAVLHVLPGSHFLPVEYPDELARELRELAARAQPA